MSIKRFASVCLATIGIVLAVMAVTLFAGNWYSYSTAREAGQLVELFGVSTRIAEALSSARGATSLALDGDPTARQMMVESHTNLDAAIDATGKLAAATALPEALEVSKAVTDIRTALADWRVRTEPVIGSDPQKVAAFRKDLINGMYDLLNKANRVTSDLERRLVAVDARVASATSLAETTWQMRDNAGRLTTMHLSAIQSGKPATTEQIHQIDLVDGHVEQSWETLTAAAGSPDSSAQLRETLAKVDADFVKPFKALRTRVASGLSTGTYDLAPTEWRRQTASLLPVIMLMRDAAVAEGRQIANDKRNRAFNSLILMSGLLIGAVGLVILVVVGIGRRVVGPLDKLTGVIGAFADGSRDFIVPFAARTDEIGAMAKAIEVLRDNAREADNRAAQEAAAIRERDRRRQRVESVTVTFVDSIDTVVGGVANAIDDLRTATVSLSESATITTEQSTIVANAAQEASVNVQTVAAAAEELSNSIQEISRRISETASATDGAVREAEATNTTMRSLADAAKRIGDVVRMITDIAFQTNLLALNATIEAARAGEAGKGFAVVAGEVKNLASQTARATEDIQAQVSAIQAETEQAVAAIGGIANTIGTVNQYTMGIASAVEQQGAATQEIARNVQQAAAGTNEVSQSIGQVLYTAQQTGAAADQLSGLADRLSASSNRLQSDVGGFVAEVKAG